jgi:hypothetical protein
VAQVEIVKVDQMFMVHFGRKWCNLRSTGQLFSLVLRRVSMRIKFFVLVTGLLLSSPTNAQTYNGFVAEPSYDFSNTTMSWAYGMDQSYSAAKVLARLRELCGSSRNHDQYYCARGMKVLKKAHAEYQLRLAARAAAAQ